MILNHKLKKKLSKKHQVNKKKFLIKKHLANKEHQVNKKWRFKIVLKNNKQIKKIVEKKIRKIIS